jgi:hypothetical protein
MGEETCFLFLHQIQFFLFIFVTPAVSYSIITLTLLNNYSIIELAACSVELKISRGARKLARTPRVIKKKV